MSDEIDSLPPLILGDADLQDRLVAAVLSGEKTATSSLHRSYVADDEPLPQPGRQRLMARNGSVAGVVEITDVQTLPISKITDEIAQAEGEGFADVAAWRRAHEQFWEQVGESAGGSLPEDELIVVERFRLLPPAQAV